MAGSAAFTLVFPHTPISVIWSVNPGGHQGLAAMHGWAVLAMVATSAACGVAAVGLWRRRPWGYTTAVCILGLQMLGDIAKVISGREPRAIVGVPVVALLVFYLSRPAIRAWCRDGAQCASSSGSL
jgi:hypothetical protein